MCFSHHGEAQRLQTTRKTDSHVKQNFGQNAQNDGTQLGLETPCEGIRYEQEEAGEKIRAAHSSLMKRTLIGSTGAVGGFATRESSTNESRSLTMTDVSGPRGGFEEERSESLSSVSIAIHRKPQMTLGLVSRTKYG